MTNEKAIEILEQLMDGVNPETGEVLQGDHVCAEPQVLRAFHLAIVTLRGQTAGVAMDGMHTRNGRLSAGRLWTVEDDAELTELYQRAMSMEDICRLTQRRRRGVANRLAYLGLEPHPSSDGTNVGQPWSEDEEKRLIELYQSHASVSDIAKLLKRNPGGITARLERLGLLGNQRANFPSPL